MQFRNISSAIKAGNGIVALLVAAIVIAGIADWSSVAFARSPEQAHIKLPAKYRDWKLISVAHEAGNLNDIRAVLGNDAAVKAYRDGAQPLPDGAMIVRLAWTYSPSVENNKAFGHDQSFVAGLPTNIQLMVKDSKKFKTTGGWGYAQFADAQSANSVNDAAAGKCFACHVPAKAHDYVFTHYAP